MIRLAVVSQKGGPGKTTTAVNLGTGLAMAGNDVVIVDVEPQAQAGAAVGVRLDPVSDKHLSLGLKLQMAAQGLKTSVDDILLDRSEILAKWKNHGRLEVLAAEQETMVTAQHILHSQGKGRMGALDDLLESIDDQFDYAIIDTPPAVQALNAAALAAADYAVTLSWPKHQTLEGAVAMRATIGRMHADGGEGPKFLGTVLNMAHPVGDWTTEEIEVRDMLVDAGLSPFVTEIRENSRISRSYDSGVPSVAGFARHDCGKRYANLLKEVLVRMDAPESEWEIAPSASEVLDAMESASV
ncbi:Sporulation initiation inhibitor protein Soj [Streptomyces sp. YIM 130001]|uniref:ParA family protein n=1 Tax=Streptomyces sp. YIM 130001 TaxID=2259644 RepID=UPI000E646B74|nr:ParA family protein [Streptomyces sp. YIM 130001]RII06910.1 Sporulation initiation inhibitor protein Soj [Streptomyces sp. YIM 130001]